MLLALSCQNNQWEQCEKEAERSNRQCPKIIDSQTQLDSIKFNKHDKKFAYYYSLSGESDSTFQATIDSKKNKERTLDAVTNSYELHPYLQLNITFEYNYYSKLSDLKVKLLEAATDDAKQRAAAMLKATNNKVGNIQSVKMGVFQIVAKDSTDVSDYGIYNTNAKDKKINAVVNATFTIK